MTPFFNDVMLRLPSVLRINKRFDLMKTAEREPTAAVNELIETVKALKKESELFAALEELKIEWVDSQTELTANKRRRIENQQV